MDPQELQDREKVSIIWVKNLNSIVNKMNNTKSLIKPKDDMKPKDAIKLHIFELDKSGTYTKEKELAEDGLHRYQYQPERSGEQKGQTTDFIWSKGTYRLDQVAKDPGSHVCSICKVDLTKLLYTKNQCIF